jgi:hypothetical protein
MESELKVFIGLPLLGPSSVGAMSSRIPMIGLCGIKDKGGKSTQRYVLLI